MCFPPGWLTFIRTSASQTLCKTVAVGQPRLSRQRLCFNQWPKDQLGLPRGEPQSRARKPLRGGSASALLRRFGASRVSRPPQPGLVLTTAGQVHPQQAAPRPLPPWRARTQSSLSPLLFDHGAHLPSKPSPPCGPRPEGPPFPRCFWGHSAQLQEQTRVCSRSGLALPRVASRGQPRKGRGPAGTAPRAARAPGCTLHTDPTFQ